jgi:YbbR domain-containing protein
MPHFPLNSRILRAALFEDWLLKFICLALAIMMWFYIDGELTDQRDIGIALRPADLELPAGLEFSERPLPKFTVRVRGPRRRLQLLSAAGITFKKKKLSNPQPGKNVLAVQPADLEAEGFSVLSVTPMDEEVVELVAIANQLKTVRVKPRGEPKTGYLPGQPQADPAQVNVRGPSKYLWEIDYVWTEDVDIAGADSDVVREVGILPYVDVNDKRIPVSCSQKVHVTVAIRPVEVTRRMSFDVRALAPLGAALAIEPKNVEVEVVAEESAFAVPDVISGIVLYVDWPANWDIPKDPSVLLEAQHAQVRAMAPPHVQVRGLNGAALPTVEIRGALAGALK